MIRMPMALEGLDEFGASALQNLRIQRLMRRGAEDGAAGKPIRSEAIVYGTAYRHAVLERQCEAGEVLLAQSRARLCTVCGFVDTRGLFTHCGMTHEPAPMTGGVLGVLGPSEEDDPLMFYDTEELRRLVVAGVDVVNTAGEYLNAEFLVQ